ncbi:MAG: prepilin-type cleavage/methylation domain-containing protein [Methylotenera sp.]|nr:MAG: prepilin-type cleavage/methylation domain-containing protein [Methylotenera sp.]
MKNTRKLAQLTLQNPQKGIAILEALIALVIFSMGILALVGLQAAMIKNTSDNKYRADASFLAQERIGRMWANPNNLGSFSCTDATATCADVSSILPNGTRTVNVAAKGLVTINIAWRLPGGDAHTFTTETYIGAL